MQTAENTIVNPLGLPVEWRASVTPLHEVTDPARAAEIAASMKRDGWASAPVVADYDLREADQDRAYTGVHRLAAWDEAPGEPGVPVPCVWIEDIAEAAEVGWAALMDKDDRDPCLAAAELRDRVPAGIREAYGLDVG